MRRRVLALLIIFSILLVACESEDQGMAESIPDFISMEDEAVLEYAVPKSVPHILVDQLGYLPGHTKQAFFFGSTMPETFSICLKEDGSVKYQGKTETRGYSDVYDCNVAIGDFSDFNESGEYYICADYLGESYSFSIEDDIYNNIFYAAQRNYYYNRCGITITDEYGHNACHTANAVLREDMTQTADVTGGWHQDATGSKDIQSAAQTTAVMLLAYELYGDAFSDDVGIPESGNGIPDILDEIHFETDWLFKMQDSKTGAVYSAVTVVSKDKSEKIYLEAPSIDAAYAYAFVMAKMSYIYQRFDREYATSCLQAADRAWKYCALNESADDASEWKMAATAEIYRASGLKDCRKYLDEYFLEPRAEIMDDPKNPAFYGGITYLSTTQKIDNEACNIIISRILKNAENISSEARSSSFLVPCDEEQANNAELLNRMITQIIVDYVITNHEYDNVIENYLHYFLGRNPISLSYIDGAGTISYQEVSPGMGIMKQFDNNAKLIFLLSKIVDRQDIQKTSMKASS